MTAEQITILTALISREENRLVKLVNKRVDQGMADIAMQHLKKAYELREIKKIITGPGDWAQTTAT